MVLQVYKDDILRSVHKNRIELVRAFLKAGIKGFGEKVLRDGLRNTTTFIKKNYKIVETSKLRTLNKITKLNPKFKEMKFGKRGIKGGTFEIDFKNRTYYSDGNITTDINEIGNSIKTRIKDKVGRVNKRYFQVVFTIRNNGDDKKELRTVYSDYKMLFENINDLLDKIFGWYEETELIKIQVHYKQAPEAGRQLILKSMNVKDLDDYYCSMITKNNKIELFKFLKKWVINHVNTTKDCFVKSVLHSYLDTDDSKTVSNKLRGIDKAYNYSEQLRELETQANILTMHLKTQINVYFSDLKTKIVYGEQHSEEKIVNVFVIHGHAFYLTPRIEPFDETKFMKQFIEQRKMKISNSFYDNKTDVLFGSLDFETYNDENNTYPFYLGYKIDKNKYETIFKSSKDINIIEKFFSDITNLKFTKSTKIIFYAHNGGKFDNTFILQEAVKKNIRVTNILRQESRLLSFILNLLNCTVEFRDSSSIMGGKLSNLLKDFGCKVQKLELDEDYSYVTKDNFFETKTKKMYKNYLKNDVMGLYELVTKWKKLIKTDYNLNLENILTSASIARKYIEKTHDWKKYPLYEISDILDSELRQHYIGGRIECFSKNSLLVGLYYYDFTSFFPYIMTIYDFGYGLMKIKKPKRQEIFSYKWFGLVKCEVKSVNKDNIPLHGVRINSQVQYIHHDDWVTMYLSTEEIKYSIENDLGYEYKFIEVYHYDNKAKYFKPIIDTIYSKKIDAEVNNNKSKRKLAKTIINSTYGITGINRNRESVEIKTFPDALKREFEEQHLLSRGNLIDFTDMEKTEDNENNSIKSMITTIKKCDIPCSNIIIAMMITSYSRLELYKLINTITEKGGIVPYIATDAIVTDYCIENDKQLMKKYNVGVKGDILKLGDLTNESGELGGKYDTNIFIKTNRYCMIRNGVETIKFSGLNTKQTYIKRIVDKKKKHITFKGISNKGTKKVTSLDFQLMAQKGYIMTCDNYNFTVNNILDIMSNESSIKHIENTKTF